MERENETLLGLYKDASEKEQSARIKLMEMQKEFIS